MSMTIELDVHTHTLASGHAYGTISEMAAAAAARKLKILGITEHAKGIPGTCEDIYFLNMDVVPRSQCGVELLLGSEINILDYAGTLSLPERVIQSLDIRIAGIHRLCYEYGTCAQNTAATLAAIRNPAVDVISHPDDANCPLDYEAVVAAAKECHTLLEINNNSLRSTWKTGVRENIVTILTLCRREQLPVLLSSDAHHMVDVGNVELAAQLLSELDFPEELVINRSAALFKRFLADNRRRERDGS